MTTLNEIELENCTNCELSPASALEQREDATRVLQLGFAAAESAGSRALEVPERSQLPGNQPHHKAERQQCRFSDPHGHQEHSPKTQGGIETGLEHFEEKPMKKIDPDDPKLTAYALGELDASERAAIEAALEAHPEWRALVDEIQQTAALLSNATPALLKSSKSLRLQLRVNAKTKKVLPKCLNR